MPTPLQSLLHTYRDQSQTQREKGTYFEELIRTWFRHEATYADLYSDVWLYGDWARQQGKDARDVGIDLVAKTETGEYHAIQCKFHAPDYRIKKSDIDSFFTASGQAPFTHRIIVSTSIVWSEHADDALRDQTPPVTKIDLTALEESRIDWSRYRPGAPVALKAKKELRPHQENALTAVKTGLQRAGRGKLIMACGTGKTFTSLKIAEAMAGAGKRVLFLVPSLALLSQILTEWTQESETPLHSFAVCSDREVGKKRPRNANRDDARNNEDRVETFAHELRYPATTDARALAQEVAKRHDAGHMSVVFSTYHSIGVISEAQHYHDLEEFDLIVCDEAHRTTGATYTEEDDSHFVKIHDAGYIQGRKRLYMTATPRIYGDMAQAIAERGEVALYSMDNPEYYGSDLHTLTFSEAVNRGLLVDYKVIVLAMDEAHISRRLQNLLKDENNALRMDDAAKIVGCWKALNKHQTEEERRNPNPEPMRRAVAFCQVIEPGTGKNRTHKVSSKQIAGMFQAVVEAYQRHDSEYGALTCQAEHVDGSMNASQKEAKLSWLRADPPENTCRILSNVRCLSEGVDVPALDAVLFLTPRNSQVDVVQSVGRVMRNAPGKTRGYVILPVVIPAGVKPHEALADNRTYKVVWEVLQALRSHDDRFDAMINKMDLTGAPPAKMEVIAIDDRAIRGAKQRRQNLMEKLRAQAHGGQSIGLSVAEPITPYQTEIEFAPGEVERALYAKIVEKCGRRTYWEEWATDIASIARAHITRIQTILQNPANREERRAFHAFVAELRDDLNPAITEAEVVEMLAQHLITRPVFEALFDAGNYKITSGDCAAPQAFAPGPRTIAPAPREAAPGPREAAPGPPTIAPGPPTIAPGPREVAPGPPTIAPGPREVAPASPTIAPGPREVAPASPTIAPGPREVAPASPTIAPESQAITRTLDPLHQHSAQLQNPLGTSTSGNCPDTSGNYSGNPTGSNSFAANNPVSQGMQQVLDLLHEHHLEKEADTLEGFYASVKMRAEGIDSAAGKQRIVVELYDKFFRNAFPRMTERLGIVYTPVEVVDFILHSIDHLLRKEFGQTLGSRGVHILDPFTGTGTFITRLIQSGLITPEELPDKYQHEIHANEIVLLAYYIAAVNIEAAYHGRMGGRMGGQMGDNYRPFPGICLTDTFQMYETDDRIRDKLKENSDRRIRQKGLKEIRVILGNPPYSARQKNENDNNENIEYPGLDERIRTTYAERTKATNKNALYDSYIRAIRWASDRIGDSGVIGFVTNAGYLETNLADGLRQCLAEEFSSLYILHLRGNQRTSGELSRKEGGKIFGSGSRAPIAISLLVKNPDASRSGQIRLHDIGDYLTREQKLEKIASFTSVSGITDTNGWQEITPDRHGDWLNQRADDFNDLIALGDKKGNGVKLFDNFSLGINSARDVWCYNYSRTTVERNMKNMIDFYNREVVRFEQAHTGFNSKEKQVRVDDFIDTDSRKIGWARALKADLAKNHTYPYRSDSLIHSLYRPFSKQWFYFSRHFNEMVYQMPRIFPNAAAANFVICMTGLGDRAVQFYSIPVCAMRLSKDRALS